MAKIMVYTFTHMVYADTFWSYTQGTVRTRTDSRNAYRSLAGKMIPVPPRTASCPPARPCNRSQLGRAHRRRRMNLSQPPKNERKYSSAAHASYAAIYNCRHRLGTSPAEHTKPLAQWHGFLSADPPLHDQPTGHGTPWDATEPCGQYAPCRTFSSVSAHPHMLLCNDQIYYAKRSKILPKILSKILRAHLSQVMM